MSGSAKNFLFTLSPHFRIYHSARITDNNFQYLASSGFNLPHGLGFGGSLEGFRLFIPDSLEQCTVRALCTTYEPGRLVFRDVIDVNNIQFEIEHLEVWGSGGSELIETGLRAQADHRNVLAHTIEKARKVDKAQFFNNGFDREFLLPNTLAHHKDMQERVEEQYVTTAPASAPAPTPIAPTPTPSTPAAPVRAEPLPSPIAPVAASRETTPTLPIPASQAEQAAAPATEAAPATTGTN